MLYKIGCNSVSIIQSCTDRNISMERILSPGINMEIRIISMLKHVMKQGIIIFKYIKSSC